MGIRQTLNDNPRLAAAVTFFVILGAATIIVRQSCSPDRDSSSSSPASPAKLFFTIDDGKSWFPDDARKVPPFDYQGKTAYRVRIFRCPDGKQHISHLERYNPADKKRLEDVMAKHPEQHIDDLEQAAYIGLKEVKEVGAKDWVKVGTKTAEEYAKIQRAQCPDGGMAVGWVEPE